MEQGETLAVASNGHNGHKEFLASPIINGLRAVIEAKRTAYEAAQRQKEWNRQFDLQHVVPAVAADFLEATKNKKMPDQDVIRRLYANGYIDYTPEDILESGIFNDWEGFVHCVVEKRREDDDEKLSEKNKLLAQIRDRIADGQLPFIFAGRIERYQSEKQMEKEENNPPQKKEYDMARLSGELASDDELIRRYAKYLIASELVVEQLDENGYALPRNQDIYLRRLNISLGANTDSGEHSGKILNHSLIYEILGSNALLDKKEDVTESDIYQTWFDVLKPKERKDYLKGLAKATKPADSRRYFYSPARGKYLEMDASKKAEVENDYGNLIPLSEALLNDEIDVNYAIRMRYKYQDWGKQEYVKAGLLLNDILRGMGTELDMHLWEKASRLGIVPGESSVRKLFSGYLEFFRALGMDKKQGLFNHLEESDFISHLLSVAEETGLRVTEELLWERIRNGANEPSPRVMTLKTRKSFSELLMSAGLPVYKRNITPDDCITLGARFINENGGKEPTKNDIDETPYLPSNFFIRSKFGSITNYRQLVREYLSGNGNGHH